MIDDFLATHATSLHLRARRTKILASNIANADTPNYKAKDLAFAEVLRDANTGASRATMHRPDALTSLRTTDPRHMTRASTNTGARIMYRQPMSASLDGNTVDKDQEQARFAENTIRYQASLEFINSRVNGLIRALKGE